MNSSLLTTTFALIAVVCMVSAVVERREKKQVGYKSDNQYGDEGEQDSSSVDHHSQKVIKNDVVDNRDRKHDYGYNQGARSEYGNARSEYRQQPNYYYNRPYYPSYYNYDQQYNPYDNYNPYDRY